MQATRLTAALFGGLALATSQHAFAGDVLDGCYVPERGYAESVSLSATEQLGLYRVVLVNANWQALTGEEREKVAKRLVLSGPFKGTITASGPPISLDHVLSDDERDGLLLTSGDTAYLAPTSACILAGTETINLIAGTGRFTNLSSGSFTVEGTVNFCNGENDFYVVPHMGQICFDASAALQD
jgi:hypothetical protein